MDLLFFLIITINIQVLAKASTFVCIKLFFFGKKASVLLIRYREVVSPYLSFHPFYLFLSKIDRVKNWRRDIQGSFSISIMDLHSSIDKILIRILVKYFLKKSKFICAKKWLFISKMLTKFWQNISLVLRFFWKNNIKRAGG